jgi:hypothetical protein
VDVHNTSGVDEVLTLTGLTDTAFGNITQCTNANCASGSGANGTATILGTTCGVASSSPGLGTLSGATGGGVLPATIAVDGHYTCQFDAQFCSAVDASTCISNTDSVNATLHGDEGATDPVTVTANTITVKECLTRTEQ